MKPSMKRLAKDHVSLRKNLPPNYFFENDDDLGLPDDLTQLLICLTGPEGTPFVQGFWRIRLDIPLEYPQRPPTATFTTKIFHPNVAEETGAVCLETLKRDWDPKLTLKDILVAISCLLIQPNPDSALNQKAGALIQENFEAYSRQAKLMTKIHAPVPDHLVTAANAARCRGESPSDATTGVLQESQQTQNTQATNAEPQECGRILKRSLEGSEELAAGTSDRKRKSPKYQHVIDQSDTCTTESPSKSRCPTLSTGDVQLPQQVIFRARWASGKSSGPRIGIRRL